MVNQVFHDIHFWYSNVVESNGKIWATVHSLKKAREKKGNVLHRNRCFVIFGYTISLCENTSEAIMLINKPSIFSYPICRIYSSQLRESLVSWCELRSIPPMRKILHKTEIVLDILTPYNFPTPISFGITEYPPTFCFC